MDAHKVSRPGLVACNSRLFYSGLCLRRCGASRRVALERGLGLVVLKPGTCAYARNGKVDLRKGIALASSSEPKELSKGYSVDSLEQHFSQKPWQVANRVVEVISALSSVLTACGWPLTSFESIDKGKLGEELSKALTDIGPTFVKLGQTLATRPDVIGEEIAEKLESLQTGAPPFDDRIAFSVMEKELGVHIGEVFSFVSPQAVASASLGQVYFAVLARNGRKVAIKVQRPGMLESITLDIFVLRLCLGLVKKVAGINQDIRLIADEVGQGLCKELDYVQEGMNSEEFKSAHKHLGYVDVPDVIWDLTTSRVLTTEWIPGLTPTDYLSYINGKGIITNQTYNEAAARRLQQLSKPEAQSQLLNLLSMGVECSLSQLLETGMMHADPHPGNVMMSADGRIIYLDFGLITRVPTQSSQAMMSALVHIVLGKWDAVTTDLDGMGLLKSTIDRKALAKDLESEFFRITGQEKPANGNGQGPAAKKSPLMILLESSSTQLTFGSVSRVILKLAVKYRFVLPPYYTLIVRSLATLEGLALKSDPDFKIVRVALPIVMRRLVCDSRPAAVALLRELILDESLSLRLDWLGDLIDLWRTEKTAPPPPQENQPAQIAQEVAMDSTGQSNGSNGSMDLTVSSLNRMVSENGCVPAAVLEQNNGNGGGVNEDNLNGSGVTTVSTSNGSGPIDPDPSDTILYQTDRQTSNSDASTSVSSGASTLGGTSDRHSTTSLLKSEFVDAVLSRRAHGFRRVLMECDVPKVVGKMRGEDGERCRKYMAVKLAAVIAGGLKSILCFPLWILSILTFRKRNWTAPTDTQTRVQRKRFDLLVKSALKKIHNAGIAAYIGAAALVASVVVMMLRLVLTGSKEVWRPRQRPA